MNIHATKARAEDKESIIGAVRWCKRQRLSFGGFPYDDPLAGPDGVHLILLVPEGTSNEQCQAALREGYQTSDVVYHTTKFCPPLWLETE